MEFVKYHGLGNDFVFVEDYENTLVRQGAVLAPQICQRNFGIGADGLVFITKPADVYTMRIFNADGSEAEMCGNAIRCIAKHLWDQGLVQGTALDVGTLEGTKHIVRRGDDYAVNMGQPQWLAAQIPMEVATAEAIQTPVKVGDKEFAVTAVSMGNPHAVVFVEDIDAIAFTVWGPALERHPVFPAKSNVEFVEVLDRETLRVKVWERGVGPTLACGTGACASAAAAARLGFAERQVKVHLPGGTLQIQWHSDNNLWMIGPAQRVFSGRWELEQ